MHLTVRGHRIRLKLIKRWIARHLNVIRKWFFFWIIYTENELFLMHRFLFFFSFVSHANQIAECTLAPFVSGSTSEKIPFVFLPLHGQIIHPSKEINFQGKCYARLSTVWVQRACRCPWNDNLTFSSSLSSSNQNSWCIILSFKNLFALPASRIRENYKLILSEQQEEDWLSQLSVSQPDTAEMINVTCFSFLSSSSLSISLLRVRIVDLSSNAFHRTAKRTHN